MKSKIILAIYILVYFSTFSFAQHPISKKWDKRFGGDMEENFSSIVQTSDGGYILGGWSKSSIGGEKSEACRGSFDYWIIKIDSNGIKQWDKTYGGTDDDRLISIKLTNDGGFICGGKSKSGIGGDKTEPAWGNNDYWIVKLDSLGNKQWDKRFGGTGGDEFSEIEQDEVGNYYVFGSSTSPLSGDKTQSNWGSDDYWLVKTDSVGNKLWDRRFGGISTDRYCTLSFASNNTIMLAGWSGSDISGDKSVPRWDLNGDFWIIKIDTSGTKIWDKRYGGIGYDAPSIVLPTFDGGFLLSGISYSNLSGDKTSPLCISSASYSDYWLVKIDSAGIKEWDNDFGSDQSEYQFTIYQTLDSGFVISGLSYRGNDICQKTENNLTYHQNWVIKTNSLGVKEWDKTIFGPSVSNSTTSAIPLNNNCFIFANNFSDDNIGYNTQTSRGGFDFWISKFCDCESFEPPHADFNATQVAFCEPNCIDFVDVSDCVISRQWFFPGGIPSSSTDQIPTVCYSDSGSYNVTLIVTNSNGTDTLIRNIYITVFPAQAPFNIFQSADSLIGGTVGFYQWYDDNGLLIGDTNQVFVPDSSGYYYLCVTNTYGCELCSPPLYYYITGISDISDELNSYIKIIPNPATNKFVIHFNDYVEKGRVEIIDVFGKLVFETSITQSNQIEIDQPKFASGVYYVNFTNGKFDKKGKFVYSNY